MVVFLSISLVIVTILMLYFIFSSRNLKRLSNKFLDMVLDQKKEIASKDNLIDTLKFHYNLQKSINEQTKISKDFSQADLKSLRNILHPDRHQGSERACELFKKVNDLIK